MSVLRPSDIDEAGAMVRDVAASRSSLEIIGGGTRRGLGRPAVSDHVLDMSGISGITLYEPAELVMGARAGTALSEVQRTLDQHGQMLAFEPMDHRQLFGTAGEPTIGAVFAANISGPRRLSAGAARDHLLGVTIINGRGEVIHNGGRVMKNVTGLDLVKLSAGAMGTLGAMTEVIFKVLPRPESSTTLVIKADAANTALQMMTRAMGTSCEVSSAAYLPGTGTLLRVEGFAPSVRDRIGRLQNLVGSGEILEEDGDLWGSISNANSLAEQPGEIWRISVPPSKAATVLNGVKDLATGLLLDWSGGLIWLAAPADALAEDTLRPIAAQLAGHATLIRATDERRSVVEVYQPLSEPLMRLTRGIKDSFDPARIFNSGRMYPGV